MCVWRGEREEKKKKKVTKNVDARRSRGVDRVTHAVYVCGCWWREKRNLGGIAYTQVAEGDGCFLSFGAQDTCIIKFLHWKALLQEVGKMVLQRCMCSARPKK